MLFHLVTVDPTFSTLKDVRQQYARTFPLKADFEGLPYGHSFGAIHDVFHSPQPKIRWKDYNLPADDQIMLAHTLAKLAHGRSSDPTQNTPLLEKVPRWVLRFALHHLSRDPLPPTPIVIDCLSIIAVDLDCTVSTTEMLDERCVHIWWVFIYLTKNQHPT